jgi:hypothetical protein
MKHFCFPLLLFLILFQLLSCHHNRLKINEKELAKEIIIQEKEKEAAEKVTGEKLMADTLNRTSKGFRFKEDRSVDPAHPPILIDIAGSLNNIKEIKLSDVASGITYVRMEPVPDSTLPVYLKFKYYLMDNYLVAVNLYGIHLYSKDGRFIRSIVKNKFTGVEVHPGEIRIWDDYTMKGGEVSVWANGNNLFYNYNNNIIGQKYIMEYDCSSIQLTQDYKFDPEKPDQISGLGKIVIDLNHGKTDLPKPIKHPGLSGGSPEAFFQMKNVFMLDQNSYALPTRRDDNMMVILNIQGDTLSTFTRLERLKNYTNPLQRGTDYGTQ